jgi:hypothetical protein
VLELELYCIIKYQYGAVHNRVNTGREKGKLGNEK